MGRIIHKNGDIFTSQAEIIVHGVNVMGAYGAGVAGVIAKRYPKARDLYLKKYRGEGWKLGDIQACYMPSIGIEKLLPVLQEELWIDRKSYYPIFIVNAATQQTYGRTGVHVDYQAVRECMTKTFDLAESYGFSVACPRIGAGLGGGDWNTIAGIINETIQKRSFNVEVFTLGE